MENKRKILKFYEHIQNAYDEIKDYEVTGFRDKLVREMSIEEIMHILESYHLTPEEREYVKK